MVKYSVKKPYTILVAMILVLVLGFVSFTGMQTELLPEISLPYLMVITTYPGASPEKVESSVTEPLEASLGTVNGVENVTSTSAENYSMVMLEFAEETNMDSAMVKVSSEIDQISGALPDMCGTPIIMEVSMDMMATMYLSVDYEGMDIYQLSGFVEDTVQPYLERQEGVASVSPTGMVEKTVEIRLDQNKIDEVNDRLLVQVSSKLAEAKQELADAQKEVDDGLAALEDGQSKLDEGQSQLDQQQDKVGDSLEDVVGQVNNSLPAMVGMLRQAADVLDQQAAAMQPNLDQAKKGLEQLKAAQEQAHTGLGMTAQQEEELVLGSAACLSDYLPDVAAENLPQSKADALANNGAKLKWTEEKLAEAKTAIETDYADALTKDESTLEQERAEAAQKVTEAQTALDNLPETATDEERAAAQAALDSAKADLTAAEKAQNAFKDYQTITQAQPVTTVWELDLQVETTAQTVAGLEQQIAQAKGSAAKLREQATSLEKGGKLDKELGDLAAQLLFSGSQAQISLGQYQMDMAQTQLESAESQLEQAWDQYYEAREEALKSANLDQLLNMSTISGIITAQNFSMPAGYVSQGEEQFLVKVGDAYESVEGVENTLLCSMDGIGDVRIGDVAQVTLIDNTGENYAKVNGNNAVILSVFKGSTSGTSQVSENCLKAMEELEAQYPGLRITTLMNQGDYIGLVVDNVLSSLVQGAILAILVLVIFLKDARPTTVVALSIPLSVLTAIVLMYFTGINLNIISLSGLALGIGMLVDNSIVVIENIYRLRSKGVPAARAAVQGAKQVTGAIAASTLTTVCVFLPLVFSSGLTRELLQDMALTIAYSLLASLAVALTVVPALSSTILKNCKEKKHPWFDRMTREYAKVLRFCLNHKAVPLGLSLGLLVFCVWQVTRMGMVLIPDMGSNQISVTVTMPEDNTNQQSIETADLLMERLTQVEGVDTVGMMASSSAASLLGGMGAASSDSADFSSFSCFVTLDEDSENRSDLVVEEMEQAVADLDCETVISGSMDMGSMMSTGLQIDIYGEDLDTLMAISQDVMDMAGQIEGFQEISNGQEEGKTEVRVTVDKDAAMRCGLTVAQIYSELSAAMTTSSTSTTLTVGEEEIEVVIVDETDPVTLDNLLNYEFQTSTVNGDGETVNETHTLGEFATTSQGQGVASIARSNQARTMSVTATTMEGYNTTLLSRQLKDLLEDYQVPDGYTVEMAGESSMVNDMVVQMMKMIALALVFIYLVMVAQFQSLLSPFIVIFTIPLAFTGGLLGILLSGELISLMSLMGFLLLAGVVVNNGIVYVDYTNQLRLAGMEKHDALVAAGVTRMRPIFMTALTTILSMSVMAVSKDATAAMSRGMAIVVIGGLLYATFMTLFVVPVMYDIFFRKKEMKEVDVGDDLEDEVDEAAEFARTMRNWETALPEGENLEDKS